MFSKILIANRGEIACRVIRTARLMGIATVAVYSDADRNALHVAMADEAVYIGAAPPRESYLDAGRIIEACKVTGAEAVHPGYGFLSENAGFARACNEAGIVFIGPPAAAIEAMGSKSAAKTIMEKAGVPLVPGYHEADQASERLARAASEIGYPVLLKAVAGGGGKGMRIVNNAADFAGALAAARREAGSSFGNDDMLVEKYLSRPRHVEVQVFCDRHGHAVYLFERDCSVQRRHQKVIEEAPAPGMTPDLRRAMGEAAVQAAKAINYEGAGTVEFLLDADGSFYFMEMNTRLQVEHPVTEAITGVDLVEQMIRVAAGEKLEMTQDDVTIDGWAIENRVYAEDPYRGFLPSTGRLVYYEPPVEPWADDGAANGRRGVDGIRVDDGVFEGGEVSMFYDPMIAKLVTWGETRDEAADLQVQALDAFRIEGLGHNIDFLSAIMQHPRFRSGELTTGFIAEEYPDGFEGAATSDHLKRNLAGIAGVIATADADRARRIDQRLNGRTPPPGDWVVTLDGMDYAVSLEEDGITVDGVQIELEMEYTPGDVMVDVEVDDDALTIQL
ncbi:MAG: acetyl-CoA carboxylase biotin carboxylase subunit, partial [Xanthomonadales bacterium]|nr:acetyl-CoA carboxylase biotin carboxylase subunit [Xanthomonadales bacterium]